MVGKVWQVGGGGQTKIIRIREKPEYVNKSSVKNVFFVEDDAKETHLITQKTKYVNKTSVCTQKTYLE